MEESKPFDWHRIFIGDEPPLFLLEIVFRTGFLYLFALLMIRTLGRRVAGQLSAFELIVVISFGSCIGDPMFQPDIPLIHGMAVVTCLTGFHHVLEWAKSRSPKFEQVVELSPKTIITTGVIDVQALQEARIASDEVFMLLREKDIDNLAKVQLAVIEATGNLSVLPVEQGLVGVGLPLFPPPENLTDQEARVEDDSDVISCAVCGQLRSCGRICPNCASPRCVAAR